MYKYTTTTSDRSKAALGIARSTVLYRTYVRRPERHGQTRARRLQPTDAACPLRAWPHRRRPRACSRSAVLTRGAHSRRVLIREVQLAAREDFRPKDNIESQHSPRSESLLRATLLHRGWADDTTPAVVVSVAGAATPRCMRRIRGVTLTVVAARGRRLVMRHRRAKMI